MLLLTQESEEVAGIIVKSRKDDTEAMVPNMPVNHLSQDGSKIGGQRQIAALIKLRLLEAGPPGVDLASLHRATQYEHHVGMTVVSSAGTVLARSAPKF